MRINFFAGPGAGKSTTAAWLFSELKTRQVSVELVTEYVKAWAVQKRAVNEFDQVYLFGKQMQYEYRFLSSGTKNIITDSPTLLSGIYADYYYKDIDIGKEILALNKKYEEKYPSFNIFLERNDKPYVQEGRYQNYEEAKEIDSLVRHKIASFYDKENIIFIDYRHRDSILKAVLERITK